MNEFSLKLELCADTISEVANFANDVMSAHEPSAQVRYDIFFIRWIYNTHITLVHLFRNHVSWLLESILNA